MWPSTPGRSDMASAPGLPSSSGEMLSFGTSSNQAVPRIYARAAVGNNHGIEFLLLVVLCFLFTWPLLLSTCRSLESVFSRRKMLS
ncbi:hypothetical protein M441DRAFT_359595 [Trichoderma asperellum CBS 433.97]|uniref:Uncharacterized protein n=1 Tax=Trichoderma asperellum (strain ATCC 204424 / CBS 433.97 / NBRC 101777) TaxID=1042311 RepID=A0A2T3ZDH7_TRIA4|nr:hypothetical protein M441DRAFT_359595 [Trichoderma asperellum CBS 433.97]PTB42820.1 hypothetical protein M441DRAFT_359595 [Trichoderma asperellum CBS 433.97]